jgi:hypothetical protein
MRAPLVLAVLLAGCAGLGQGADPLERREGSGTDASLPGVRVSGNSTWDGDSWAVRAEARNEGSRTYRVDAGCDSPFSLEAEAERGEPYGEVRCLSYTPPVPFRPGETLRRGWDVDPGALRWSGEARFTVVFEDAESAGEVRVPLS